MTFLRMAQLTLICVTDEVGLRQNPPTRLPDAPASPASETLLQPPKIEGGQPPVRVAPFVAPFSF
jgi:hypothetical protein